MKNIVRLANSSDIQEIIQLWLELMETHERINAFFKMSEDAESRFYRYLQSCIEPSDEKMNQVFVLVAQTKAQQNRKIIGYIMGNISTYPPVFEVQQYGDISDICVSSDFREQGIGRLLVNKAKKWYKDRGIQRIHIMAASGNPIALIFWKKMGFEPIMQQMYYTVDMG